MEVPAKNKLRKRSSGSKMAAFVIVLLVVAVVVGYFLFTPSDERERTSSKPGLSHVKPPDAASTVPPVAGVPPQAVTQPSLKVQNDYPTDSVSIPETPASSVGSSSGRLAIIIDDMGSSLAEARSLAAIQVPLTFAIIPGLHADKDVAQYASSHKIETIIHIPMQPKGWPSRRLEVNGLLVSMNADELQERVSRFVQQFPGAVGANNHMGSEFTEQEEKMVAVLQVFKEKDLFFIDSVTSPESRAFTVAQRLGVRSARRNVFLDNEQERGYIIGQLNQAVRLAKRSGSAIAICHPHPATIAALAAMLPELTRQGVKFVPVSQLVR